MQCPACSGPSLLAPGKDYLRCEYCSTLHFPAPNADGVRVLEVTSEYPCPACHGLPQQLTKAAAGSVALDYCTRCHGLLISMGVFGVLLEELRSRHEMSEYAGTQPDWDSLRRKLKCPSCAAPMTAHPYAGPGAVIIDSCSACLLNWLDRGELYRIVRAPDRRFATLIDEDERQKIAAEAENSW